MDTLSESSTSRVDRLPMRHNQRLTHEELRDEVAKAIDEVYPGTQSDLARALGVHRSSISRAVREAGPALAELQRRILEQIFPDYAVEKEQPVITYRVRRRKEQP